MSLPPLLKTIAAIWNHWTEPFSAIQDVQQRQKSKSVAALLLAGTIISIITTIQPLFFNQSPTFVVNQVLAGSINVLLLVVLFHIARQGRYQLAVLLMSVLGSFSVVVAAFLLDSVEGLRALYYLAVLIVFSGMFLRWHTSLLIYGLQIILMLIFGSLIPHIDLSDILLGAVKFNGVLAIVTLLMVWHRDRWEQQQRERLMESEQRHRIIADMLADYAYVLTVKPDGTFQRAWLGESTHRLLETGVDPARLMDTVESFHPDDQQQARRHFQAMLTGSIQSDELRYIFEGAELWLRLTHLPVKEAGQVRQIYGTVQNITDHKIAQQQQFEAAMARERYDLVHGFFRAVSHDFRTSLSVIRTNQYLVQTLIKRGEFDKLADRFALIDEQVDRLTHQLENLKLISALNSPTRPCNPNDLVQVEIAEHQAPITTKALQVTFIPDPDAPLIAVNPDEIQRAVGHLLENAIRFSPQGEEIEVRVSHQAEQVMLSISDCGPGIPLDEQERIFEFFYRDDEARSITSGGIGLGLSIAKIVAEAYGGRLDVESTPGHGSKFTLTIPGTK